MDKNFVKGYFRHALALQSMDNLEGALESVKRGLGIESTNSDLKRMQREIEEALRLKKVQAAITQAEGQVSANDITGAFKTIEGALRLDPDNKTLNNMMNKVRPKYEQLEKQRISNLDPRERIKEEGDAFFKAANFEKAIISYTKCLDMLTDKVFIDNYNYEIDYSKFLFCDLTIPSLLSWH